MVVQALFLGYVNAIAPDDGVELEAATENYATCVALNPRVEDACEYDTDAGMDEGDGGWKRGGS